MSENIIIVDSEILGGTPVFYGTRVPVKNLFDYLEEGDNIDTFLEDFDAVKRDQVMKVLSISQELISKPLTI
jgi:uncharacterized protein (DUF433 family)